MFFHIGSLASLATMNKWGLSNFNRTYTTDSYSLMVAAFRVKLGINWIPCRGHVIHDAIKQGLTACLVKIVCEKVNNDIVKHARQLD